MNNTILALDFENKEIALEFLKKFESKVYVKVGMQLFYDAGKEILTDIKEMGHGIFLDLKLHDIPNTVEKAMENLARLDVDMVNVHAAGGIKMMQAAIKGLETGKIGVKRPLCIAVTQLTSTSKETMNKELNIEGEVIDTVLKYAENAKEAGLDGVVCSVEEVEKIHEICGEDFLTVTPGIRLADDSKDDQSRVATPSLARERGSNYIVVGRSITKSENPVETYNQIEKTMEA